MSDSASRAEIESYRNQVLQGNISCELPPCPFCGALPDGFRRHEARRRTFYVIGGQWVEIVWCCITRWKCSHCGKIRTQQPPFALPYKRYTRQTLMGFSQGYVENEASSYRKAVLEDGLPIGYASKPGEEEIDERQLAPSTLYRWGTTLGGFKEVLRSALDLILQKEPASAICRGLAWAQKSLPQNTSKPHGKGSSGAAGSSFTWRGATGILLGPPFSPTWQPGAHGDELDWPPLTITEEAR